MKLVLDMNIPFIWKEFLKKQGHEVTHWSEVGNIRAEDSEIMAWARKNKNIVFTHDLDFGTLLYITKAKKPSVIQLRIHNLLPSAVGKIVIETLQLVSEELINGALVIINPKRHKIRLLPLQH